MTQLLTIGNLSKATGLPAKTIRFYEETGLISKPERAENGYRMYTETAIKELQLIKYTRDLGLPIPEIKKLLVGCEKGDCKHSKEFVEKEISNYVTQVDEKIHQLYTLKQKLHILQKHLREDRNTCDDSPFYCNILSQIENLQKGGDA